MADRLKKNTFKLWGVSPAALLTSSSGWSGTAFREVFQEREPRKRTQPKAKNKNKCKWLEGSHL